MTFENNEMGVELELQPTGAPPSPPKLSGGKRRLTENILALYALQGLNYLVPLAVLPYLVRVLGMNMYGLTSFAQAFAQYFTIATDYGFSYSASRSIARNREDLDAISRLFCAVNVIKLAMTVIGAVILVGIVVIFPRFHEDLNFYIVAYISVIGNALFPIWFFQGIEKMRYISVISGLAKVASAIALFIFVHRPEDGLLALGIQSAGFLVAGIIGFVTAFSHFHIRLRWPSYQELKVTLVDGWHLFVSIAAMSLYTNTNLFLVGVISGNTEAGYFSAAQKLIRAMQGLIGPITQAIYPHVNELVAHSKERALRFGAKTLKWIGTATLVPSLIMLIFARPIAVLTLGHSAASSAPILRWIALLPFLIAVSNVLGVQTMIPFGLDKQFSRILIAAGILNLVIAIPLIHFFAAQGAGASLFLVEAFVTLTMYVVLERNGIYLFRSEKATA